MNKVEEAKASFEAAIRIMPNHLEVGPGAPCHLSSGLMEVGYMQIVVQCFCVAVQSFSRLC